MNFTTALRTIRQECSNAWRDWRAPPPVTLETRERDILHTLRSKGLVIIPNFYSRETCDELRAEVDRLLETYRDQRFVDDEDTDHRIFGADRVSPLIKRFYDDPFITRIGLAHAKSENIVGLTMAARLEHHPGNTRGSGDGWHRDWAVNKQFKAIVYLSDVAPENGPFRYLRESHRHTNIIRDGFTEHFDFNQVRFSDEAVERLIAKHYQAAADPLPAPMGTLILVNTRGMHRGIPIQEGTRHALTNYYWSDMSIPEHIAKIAVGTV